MFINHGSLLFIMNIIIIIIIMFIRYSLLFIISVIIIIIIVIIIITPSPPTKSFDFRGFDSSRLLILRGGNFHVRIFL